MVDRNTNDGGEIRLMVKRNRIGRKLTAGNTIGEVQSITALHTPTVFGGLSIPQYTDPTPRRPRL